MNLQEFKAWFEGFSENLDGPPDEKKWDRIKEKISKIDGQPTPYPVFIRDYWPDRYFRPYWSAGTYCGSSSKETVMNGGMTLTTTGYCQTDDLTPTKSSNEVVIDLNAWRAAGQAEAHSLGA